MIKIFNYSSGDVKELTQFLNRSMELEQFNDVIVRENVIEDPDFDPDLTFAAASDKILSGFLMAVIRKRDNETTAYIKFLSVLPALRRNGIATALYRKAEEEILSRGVKKIRLFESYPNYYMPGLDPFYTEGVCFFERNGFKKFGDCSNLDADLMIHSFDTKDEEVKLSEKGVIIRRGTEEDKIKMLDWIKINFKAWESEVTRAFVNKPISLHIAEEMGEIIAFSAYDTNNTGMGWFGPMGTSEKARGKGVGGILLKRCLKDLRKQGYKKAIIPWVGPIPFYMHYCGSKVKRVFWRYEKLME